MKKMFLMTVAAAALVAGSVTAQELKFAPGEDSKFNWASYEELKKTQLNGEQLTIFGPWLGPDQVLVESVLAYFAAATGADVRYTGSDSFEQQVVVDLEAGSAPNISIFPQPGLASDMAKRGFLTDLGAENASWLKDNYAAGQSWVDLGTYAGKDGNKAFYGFPFKTDLKSLVWYSPENFEDAGYEVPQTMEELKALTEKIVADGGTPWCIGLGSGAATGWPATDWVEDMMLRTASPEDYDKWVSNEMKFDDPVVVNAINEFGWFAKNDKFVVGGAGAVASTDFRDSPKGLFASPPQCYLHRQASFIPSFFPEGTVVGEDADFFYFPAYAEKNLGSPVLGAGTTFTITKDSKAARAFIEFLKSPIAHEVWMAQKGFLTPHKGVNPEVFTDPTVRKMNDILLQATTFRFDGSDLMPGAVGAGSFWTGMVDFVGGKSAEDVAKSIQASWDGIK
ncbi:ABC transporter substrate-binding protein [Rhizobium rosettiformans]|jgi:alpha-glucoside transport system substrate-binding protein|uniref:Carbohydrate ABC transporter substrate-binding protein n=2 Tax=Rhizobium rosettiformans TaxID=1368430 RepID=A0A4S8PVJ3_9HYPH|nr:ABC transporter substrate-binding protein [Rhizobium rosettiformans]MBA4795877.1 carbohydrate ABC transporter substrate-binding protein [Hyphomicrobiales bacterium]MBB5277457.1 alpha-glucoside transport system substrate-binding protein [Rhizobium rosettiformans]MDR7028607.1 alpha-glucoside transport system substrate-binding protein [Rhizobium rosettiformans]MDR7064111.1 alpha-glucoside transport system substrate-binding protein [Rhizobium rosettiformans]THV33812.1 carbohydrate ABC transport